MDPSLTRHTDAPERSTDQRRHALALANRVRMKRAETKAALKRGELSIVTLIADPPQYLATARIVELLRALPGYGPIKAGRLLDHCQVSPRKTITGLNERQRAALLGALKE